MAAMEFAYLVVLIATFVALAVGSMYVLTKLFAGQQ
jgi:hypothetical protein